jgi:hypothetical protein
VSEPFARVARDCIIGSWALVSAVQHFDDGSSHDEFGPNAHGYLSYTEAGTVSAVLGASDRPALAAADPQDATPDEYASSAQRFIAYAGSFTLNEATGEVQHSIDVSLFPNWEGHSQLRLLALDGDSLAIIASPRTTEDGRRFHARITWRRVRPSESRR